MMWSAIESSAIWQRQDLALFNMLIVEATAMVAWWPGCARIAKDRMRKGRLFLFESAWREPALRLQDLAGHDDIRSIHFHIHDVRVRLGVLHHDAVGTVLLFHLSIGLVPCRR